MIFSRAATLSDDIRLPQWGRAFWQDPNDGELFLAYASGTAEVNFVTSADSGVTWSAPQFLFSVDDFSVHNNFDTVMDRDGHIHCGFRYNGSGCYQFVGKQSGGGWTRASGLGEIGLVAAGDTSARARGFQGSLTMQDTPFASEIGGVTFPAVKIAVKDSSDNIDAFVLGTPYNTGPLNDPLLFSSTAAGADGGFPIIYVQNSSPPTSQVVYYDEPNDSIKRWQRDFGAYFQFQTIVRGATQVPFGPSMAIGSGVPTARNNGTVFVCSSGYGQNFFGDTFGQAIWAHNNSSYEYAFNISNGTENEIFAKTGFLNGDPSGILADSGVIPSGGIFGVGPNVFSPPGVAVYDFPGEGTNCDFTIDDNGDYLFYFQGRNEWGRQCVNRFKGRFVGDAWVFPQLNNAESGVKSIGPANTTNTGGWANMLFWGGFKALKHPTEPSIGLTKSELIVTQGQTPTYPSGGTLTVWDVQQSPTFRNWRESEFSLDYMVTSGDPNAVFIGVNAVENFTTPAHVPEVGLMFDDDRTTFSRVRNNYVVGIEFDKAREFDAMEVLHGIFSSSRPSIAISGSMDNINYTRVAFIPSGILFGGSSTYNEGNALIKYAARDQTVTTLANARGFQPVNRLDPFAARYIRMAFNAPTNGAKNIYEMKFFGPGATNPEIVTWSDQTTSGGAPDYFREFITAGSDTKVERFRRQEGTLPPGWRTYGDFEWGVVGSGDATLTSSLSTAETPIGFDGNVPSGIWSATSVGNGRGVGDGFSIRSEAIGTASGLGNPLRSVPAGGILPGHQAVLEVDINVIGGEKNSNGVTGRDISFNIRSDVHTDDVIEFYIDNVLQETYTDIGWNTFTSYTWGVDEFEEPESFPISNIGSHTLKWIYKKGAYDPYASTRQYPFGAAWIDNVGGLDAGPLEGGPRNHRLGYVKAGNGAETSTINGFAHADFGAGSIYGVIPLVDPLTSTIYGYLSASGEPFNSNINGYTVGFESGVSQINGFLIGDATDDAASSILGFVTSGFGSGDMAGVSTIYGYAKGQIGEQIIFGYVAKDDGDDELEFINGYLVGWDGGVFGLGPNQSAIYGYSPGSNDFGSGVINGYLLGNYPNGVIYGYLGSEALVGSGGGLVGNPSTSNVVPGVNFVHGYLKGEIGSQAIHGYVKRPAAGFSTRKGYVLAGKFDESIHGYVNAKDVSAESINGYASGIGYADAVINAYAFGISGIIDGAIHGYLTGVGNPNSQILGTLIGTVEAEDSAGACPSHNFPLPALPSFVLPTGGFIN